MDFQRSHQFTPKEIPKMGSWRMVLVPGGSCKSNGRIRREKIHPPEDSKNQPMKKKKHKTSENAGENMMW